MQGTYGLKITFLFWLYKCEFKLCLELNEQVRIMGVQEMLKSSNLKNIMHVRGHAFQEEHCTLGKFEDIYW